MTAWLIGAVVLAVLAGGVYFYRAGRRAGGTDAMQGVNDDVRKAQDVRATVDALPDSALDERVSKWTRRD